jgi:hypothetical protein
MIAGRRRESDGSHADVLIVDDFEDQSNHANVEGWVQGRAFGTKVQLQSVNEIE